MGSPSPLIVDVSTPAYGHVVVNTSDGRRHHVDLSPVFSAVHCYPKDEASWKAVTPDAAGLSDSGRVPAWPDAEHLVRLRVALVGRGYAVGGG